MSISISEIIEDSWSVWTKNDLRADEAREDLDDNPTVRAWRTEAVKKAIEAPCTGDLEKWSLSLSGEADKLLAELPREQRTPEHVAPATCEVSMKMLYDMERHITHEGWVEWLACEEVSERNLSLDEFYSFIERWQTFKEQRE